MVALVREAGDARGAPEREFAAGAQDVLDRGEAPLDGVARPVRLYDRVGRNRVGASCREADQGAAVVGCADDRLGLTSMANRYSAGVPAAVKGGGSLSPSPSRNSSR
jgi:hypothetical protein